VGANFNAEPEPPDVYHQEVAQPALLIPLGSVYAVSAISATPHNESRYTTTLYYYTFYGLHVYVLLPLRKLRKLRKPILLRVPYNLGLQASAPSATCPQVMNIRPLSQTM
jgi:hypothetical protein